MIRDSAMLCELEKETSPQFRYNDEWFIPRDRTEFYLTHDFHPYFAAFPPRLVSRLLQCHSEPNDVFLDPFMGGGSSIVEGIRNNRNVIGCDTSPLSKLISDVKSTPIKIKDKDMRSLISNIHRSMKNRTQVSFDKYDRITNVVHWFDQSNLTELDSIYNCISRIKNTKFKNFATVAFSSIIRKSSNAKNAEQHICINRHKTKISPIEKFTQKIELMKKQMDVYYMTTPKNKAKLHVNDVRHLSNILDKNSIDIVITSPPYGTGSKYTNIYKLNYDWLELPKPKLSLEHTKNFRVELAKALSEIHYVLKPNKYCFLVYGDPSTESGLTKKAIIDAKMIGFQHKGTISCPIKKMKAKHSVKYTQFIPKDFILILQKSY